MCFDALLSLVSKDLQKKLPVIRPTKHVSLPQYTQRKTLYPKQEIPVFTFCNIKLTCHGFGSYNLTRVATD